MRAGDRPAALRGRVAAATLAQERGEHARAATLLEAALDGEVFAPVERLEIYANLGRAYAASGRTRDAVDLFVYWGPTTPLGGNSAPRALGR